MFINYVGLPVARWILQLYKLNFFSVRTWHCSADKFCNQIVACMKPPQMGICIECGWLTGMLISVVSLGGCVFPEKFDVHVVVNADASYSIHFDGEVASVSHVNLIHQKKQPLSEDQVTGLYQEAKKMTGDTADASAKAQYLGNGRFSLVVDEKYKAGTRTSFLAALMIDPTSDGVISIYAAPLADQQKIALKKIGLNMRGSLSVTVPKNTKLISTNSTKVDRSYFSRKSTYSWDIVDISDEPELVFEVKSNADK